MKNQMKRIKNEKKWKERILSEVLSFQLLFARAGIVASIRHQKRLRPQKEEE